MNDLKILEYLYNERVKNDDFKTVAEIRKQTEYNNCSRLYKQLQNLNNRGFLELKNQISFKPRLSIVKLYRLRGGHRGIVKKLLTSDTSSPSLKVNVT